MIGYAPARQADAAALATLHAASFPRGWSSEEFASLLSGQACRAYLARRAGNKSAAGFVVARSAAGEAEILTVAVAPEHRRQGVAKILMRLLLDDLRHRGIGAAFLEVGAKNAPALRLYRRLGFTEIGRRPGYYRGGAPGDALVLRAALEPPAMVSKSAETDYEQPV